MRDLKRGRSRTGQAWRSFAFACCLSLCAATVSARTIYRWVDANGTVNFTHSAPPTGVDFEAREVREEAPVVEGEATPSPAATAAATAAHLALAAHESERVRDNVVRFKGTVKSDGTAAASQIGVSVTVTEVDTGNVCLKENITANPDKLEPGEEGTYSAEFDVPCMDRKPKIDVVPYWQ